MKKDKRRRSQPNSKRRPPPKHPRRGVYLSSDRDPAISESYALGEIDEDEGFDVSLEMHPDLNELWLDDKLPELFVDEHGNQWNPLLHLTFHCDVERQLGVDDPRGIVAVAQQLEQRGELTSHEIRHVIMASLTEQIWIADNEQREFDDPEYLAGISRHYDEFVAALMD